MLLGVESPLRLGRNVFTRRATVNFSAAASVLTVAVSLPHVAKMAIGLSVIAAGTFSSAEAPGALTSFVSAATDGSPNITTGAVKAAAAARWHHRRRRRRRRLRHLVASGRAWHRGEG